MATAGISELIKIPTTALAIASSATLVISIAFFFFFFASRWSRRSRFLCSCIKELESALEAASEKAASERRGRIRAQQDLRKALSQQIADVSKTSKCDSPAFYPMSPIGLVQSCFATRNGTPRQPLVVPLSKACIVFDSCRIPVGAFDGLAEYSHCWVLFVFHLNTDLEKLWKQPSRSKFKAKVRVPRLQGAKMGVLATRSPHRPCPIGLSVAKIEALEGHALMLSGVDLVDGTPVLDVKPYLPYSDSIRGATIPKWLKVENALAISSISFSAEFNSTLSMCWTENEKISLYASMDEFQSLIKEVLSCDIRSLSQQSRPHRALIDGEQQRRSSFLSEDTARESVGVVYHLILEGVDISYRIDESLNVMVEKATLALCADSAIKDRRNFSSWKEKLDMVEKFVRTGDNKERAGGRDELIGA